MVVILHTIAKGMTGLVQSFGGAILEESNIKSWVLLFGTIPTWKTNCNNHHQKRHKCHCYACTQEDQIPEP